MLMIRFLYTTINPSVLSLLAAILAAGIFIWYFRRRRLIDDYGRDEYST